MPMLERLKPWAPVACLSLAVFVFITAEFAPVGLLPQMAEGLGETESKTGLLMTGYAWVVALMSLPLTLLTARFNRRVLLLILLAVFAVGNMLTALASGFIPVLLCRLITAFCHAIFWSITTPLAARLAPVRPAYGLAIISAGGAMGAVLGIPTSTWIGQKLGWHATFVSISLTAIVFFVILTLILPNLPSKNAGSFKSIPALFRNKPLIAAYGVTVFLVTGHFTIYTYMVPFLEQTAGAGHSLIVGLLFIYGIAGTIGILLAAKLVDAYLREVLLTSSIAILCMLLAVKTAAGAFPLIMPVFMCWSIFMTIINISFSSWILRLAPEAADAAVSVYSGIYNVGIGSGALIGGQLLLCSGVENLGYWGALSLIPAILLIFVFARSK